MRERGIHRTSLLCKGDTTDEGDEQEPGEQVEMTNLRPRDCLEPGMSYPSFIDIFVFHTVDIVTGLQPLQQLVVVIIAIRFVVNGHKRTRSVSR